MIGAAITDAKIRALRDLAQRHFEAEEAQLFPLADDYLDEFGDGEADTLPG